MRAGGNLADSLSQYSKHSDELALQNSELDSGLKGSKISNPQNSKKQDKFVKTQKKLPDLKMGHIDNANGSLHN